MEVAYRALLQEVLSNGGLRPNRTGVSTFSLFDKSLKFNVSRFFPLITGKFVDFNIIQTEFDWFINGETNIKRFKDRGIKIWDAWADASGDLGPVYGHQMRNFNNQHDQLEGLINGLINDPYSRRHIITLWNPVQLSQMRLPPCYLYFQFYVESNNDLSMKVIQRSGDLFLGIPYDLGLFTRLLIHVGNEVHMSPKTVSVSIIDAHIYQNHVEAVNKYLNRPIYTLPTWTIENGTVAIHDYNHGPRIKAPVAI